LREEGTGWRKKERAATALTACSVKKIREQEDSLDQTELGWVLCI
jgi:hypothetical protein